MQSYPVEVEAHPTPHDGQFLADHLYTITICVRWKLLSRMIICSSSRHDATEAYT